MHPLCIRLYITAGLTEKGTTQDTKESSEVKHQQLAVRLPH